MKNLVYCLVISVLLLACTQEEKSPIEGAWKVVSWERWANDTIRFLIPGTVSGSEIKIWSDKYFVFSGQYKRDTVTMDNYGGGTYKLDGTHYEETYLYWPNKSGIGTTGRGLLEIKNDTLTQTWPCNENWQLDNANRNIQKLVKAN